MNGELVLAALTTAIPAIVGVWRCVTSLADPKNSAMSRALADRATQLQIAAQLRDLGDEDAASHYEERGNLRVAEVAERPSHPANRVDVALSWVAPASYLIGIWTVMMLQIMKVLGAPRDLAVKTAWFGSVATVIGGVMALVLLRRTVRRKAAVREAARRRVATLGYDDAQSQNATAVSEAGA